MAKEIKIKISSRQFEMSEILMSRLNEIMDSESFEEEYEQEEESFEPNESDEDQLFEFTTLGYLSMGLGRAEINYNESELTGMEGASTTVSFEEATPNLVTMLRGGSVTTAMVFEPGKRHICVYETPIMPFELCIHTLKVENKLLSEGSLYLDYIVEFKGAQAERTKFLIEIEEVKPAVFPLDEYNS